MTASGPACDLRYCSFLPALAFLLMLSCSAAYAATPGEEHAYVVFQDDFEEWDGDAWEMVIAAEASYGTSWRIVDDGGNRVLSLKGTVTASAGDADWMDYTLMVRVRLVDVPEEVQIRFRVGEWGRCYAVNVPQRDPVLTKTVGDEPRYLGKVMLTLSNETWHTFKVVCMGGGIWVYVDGEFLFEHADEESPLLSGRIGFGCGPNSVAYLDDVRVTVTRLDYVRYLIGDAEEVIEAAKKVGADVEEPEGKLKEAEVKLAEGDLATAEALAKIAAEKAAGILAEALAAQEEPPQDQQQPQARPGAALSVERVATLITIGGAAVGAVGWTFRARGNRRRRAVLFRELMRGVDDAYDRLGMDAARCEAELLRMRERAILEFKQGMITEKNYGALDARIEEHLARLRGEHP
jgi:hypothetical protein